MMMENYIEDQLLELYIEDMENIVTTALYEDYNLSSLLLEAEGDANTATTTTTVKAKVGEIKDKATTAVGNAKEAIVAKLKKLKELLGKFVEAIGGIVEKMKTLANQLIQAVANKLKLNLEMENDTSVIKLDVVLSNTDELEKINNDILNDIVNPYVNGGTPKASDISVYQERFESVRYNKLDEKSEVVYKKGTTVNGAGIFQNATKENFATILNRLTIGHKNAKTLENGAIKMNNNVNNIEEDKKDNFKIVLNATTFGMNVNKDIVKYCTRYLGDIKRLLKNTKITKAA